MTFSPESVQKSVSPVHHFNSLWQLVPCEMEDGCNEDGEQRWSNDASLLNSCVDPKGFCFVSRASTVADMLLCSSRSTQIYFSGQTFFARTSQGPDG